MIHLIMLALIVLIFEICDFAWRLPERLPPRTRKQWRGKILIRGGVYLAGGGTTWIALCWFSSFFGDDDWLHLTLPGFQVVGIGLLVQVAGMALLLKRR